MKGAFQAEGGRAGVLRWRQLDPEGKKLHSGGVLLGRRRSPDWAGETAPRALHQADGYVTAHPRSPHTHPEKTVSEWESLGDQVTLTLIPDLLTLRLEVSCLPPAALSEGPWKTSFLPLLPGSHLNLP